LEFLILEILGQAQAMEHSQGAHTTAYIFSTTTQTKMGKQNGQLLSYSFSL